MFTSKVVRHIFIPAAALVAEKSKTSSSDCNVCKPSELPIYTNDDQKIQKIESGQSSLNPLEQAFGNVRRTVFAALAELKEIEQIGESYLSMGLDNAECIISYLQEEDNTTPKYGAIAVGGLAGLIFGLRGGFFKRTIYASAGALSMAAICYPKEASEYSQIGIAEAKRYATIAYNFVNGVKKEDPPLALPSLPPMPTSLSEAWDIARNLGKSTKTSVTEDTLLGGDDDDDEEKVSSINPLNVVTEAHDTATTQSCHCPVGACMGHHEESPPAEGQILTIVLPAPTDQGKAEEAETEPEPKSKTERC